MMKIAIAGGTGLVGQALTKQLLKDGHELVILTRNKSGKQPENRITYVEWLTSQSTPEKMLDDIDVIINLAGHSINNRWTAKTKKDTYASRMTATKEITRIIPKLTTRPHVYIQASAIGYYGTSESDQFTEQTEQPGSDFLATVVQQWETEGEQVTELGVRTVLMRFGVILAKQGGALPRMTMPYKLFGGGQIGNGKQWISWVHIEDVCRLIAFAIMNDDIHGAINVTAPNPVRMKEFGKTIGEALQRPHWLPVPAFALQTLLGEMSLLVLQGQQVLPEKALQHGFKFQYEHPKDALKHLLSK